MLTERLAPHVDDLLAIDVSGRRSPRAGRVPHVRSARDPRGLPGRRFDLIVCSEVLYYLDDAAFERTLDRLHGTLLAVHWRHPTRTYPFPGDEVHDRLEARFGPPEYARAPPPTTPRPVRMRLLIVGGGPAALAAARGYREAGGDGDVTLVTPEA